MRRRSRGLVSRLSRRARSPVTEARSRARRPSSCSVSGGVLPGMLAAPTPSAAGLACYRGTASRGRMPAAARLAPAGEGQHHAAGREAEGSAVSPRSRSGGPGRATWRGGAGPFWAGRSHGERRSGPTWSSECCGGACLRRVCPRPGPWNGESGARHCGHGASRRTTAMVTNETADRAVLRQPVESRRRNEAGGGGRTWSVGLARNLCDRSATTPLALWPILAFEGLPWQRHSCVYGRSAQLTGLVGSRELVVI